MAIYMWREYVPPELCFTANTAGSTVQLTQNKSPTRVTLETSTDGNTWTAYTINTTITLTNVGDKVYFRNTSETTTGFATSSSAYYKFVMTGDINGSGDVTSLINKNCTDTITSNYCFTNLFYDCTSLKTAPKLPATTLTQYCYWRMFRNTGISACPELPATSMQTSCYQGMFEYSTSLVTVPSLPATTLADSCYMNMFSNCTSLESLPELPALTLPTYCYYQMFLYCSKIYLSQTQTGDYQTPYRFPTTGTGTEGSYSTQQMFYDTGGFKYPNINTTYYTSNTVV